ncbi:MAG: hypothetical protein WCK71_03045, partial [bacterium]
NQDKAKHEHDQAAAQTKKPGKGPITALVIVIVLAIVAVGGTWYYMNNQAKNDKKAQDEQTQKLQKQVSDLKDAETSSAPQSGDSAAILAKSKEVFNYWTSNKAKDYQDLKDKGYITQALLDFQKNPPKQADILSCSQNLAEKYVYSDPTVQSSSIAVMNVEGIYSYSGINVITLGYVKENGTWKINTVTCPTIEAQAKQ